MIRYLRRQHLVDVTEIFNMLNWEKKQRLFKLAYLVFLLFLSIFWYSEMGKIFHAIVLVLSLSWMPLTKFTLLSLQDDILCFGRRWMNRNNCSHAVHCILTADAISCELNFYPSIPFSEAAGFRRFPWHSCWARNFISILERGLEAAWVAWIRIFPTLN